MSLGFFYRPEQDDCDDGASDALAATLWVPDEHGAVHEFRNLVRSYDLWDLAIRGHFWRPATTLLPENSRQQISLRPLLTGIRFRTDGRDHRLVGVYEPRTPGRDDDPSLRVFRLREKYFAAEFDLVISCNGSNRGSIERLKLCMRFLSDASSSTVMDFNGDAVPGVHRNLSDLHPLVADLDVRLLLQSIRRPSEHWRSPESLTPRDDLNVFRRTEFRGEPNAGVSVVDDASPRRG